jgi:DNA-binding transcriptional ArsR family regulator
MSIQALNWALKQNPVGITTGAKFTLVLLANYADEDGQCYPSQRKIGELTHQGERTVRRHLEYLEKIGLIRRFARRKKDGSYVSDFYKLGSGNVELHEMEPIDDQIEPAANLAGGDVQPAANFDTPAATVAGGPAAKLAGNTKESSYTKAKDTKEYINKGQQKIDAWMTWLREKRGVLILAREPEWIDILIHLERNKLTVDDAIGLYEWLEEQDWVKAVTPRMMTTQLEPYLAHKHGNGKPKKPSGRDYSSLVK